MKATKLPSGNWRVNAYIGKDRNGKDIRKSFVGPDKKKVLSEAAIFISEHRDADVSGSFLSAANMFLVKHSDDLSPSTVRGYQNILKRLQTDFKSFCNINCFGILSDDLQGVIDGLTDSGSSPKTVRNYYGFICSVLKYKKLRPPVIDLPGKVRPELNIPDEFTVKRTLAEAKKRNTELWVCIALAACGPLREGEIAALQFTYDADVDFKNNTIHVSHDYVLGADDQYHLKEPKTSSSNRVLTMPTEIMNIIKKQGYVTCWNSKQIYLQFSRLCRDCGIAHYRFHDLRHYCASLLHAKGYPDAYIQQRTGHATADVLRNVYTHTLTEEKKKIESNMLKDFSMLIS